MAWVQIQKAEQVSWEDYERVGNVIGEVKPAGLIFHAAGEVDGRWQSVSVWESREDFDTFLNEHVLPAVRATLGDELAETGPPPTDWFEAKQLITS